MASSTPASAIPPSNRPPWVVGALLLLAVIASYANSLSGPFFYDDGPAIVSNRTIAEGATWGEALRPPAGTTVSGRPLLNLSFAINRRVSGLEVRGYHLTNLAIHAAATLLLFGLVRRTLELPGSEPTIRDRALLVAALAAAWWGLHPVQTEAVTFIVQRAESLMGFFFLLTFYAFVRSGGSDRKTGWLVVSVLACWCGAAVKEIMVMAPVLVLCFDRIFVAGSWRSVWSERRFYHAGLFASWLLLGALVAFEGGNRNGSMGEGSGIDAVTYWLTQVSALTRYLRLAVWPGGLVFDYGYGQVAVGDWGIWFLCLGSALLFISSWVYALRRVPRAAFLGTWFLLILAPTSLVPGGQTIAEHRLYLSLAAVAVGFGLWLGVWAGRWGRWVAVGWIGVLAVLTAQRNTLYRSEVALWSDSVAKFPSSAQAHNNLGTALAARGEVKAGMAEFDAALKLVPGFVDAHYNAARAQAALGNGAGAIAHYEEAIRRRPEFAEAHDNLGAVLFALGRQTEALAHFRTAVRLRPDSPESLGNLGNAELAGGDAASALKDFERALTLRPEFVEAHHSLGNALWVLGRKEEAIAHFKQALVLRPDFGPSKEALEQAGVR